MGTLQGAWVPPSLQFVLLDTGGCIHVMISADKAVLARLVNVRLQKRQHDIALLLKICVPVEDPADRYVHVAPDAVASKAPTLSDDVLAGNEPAVLFHLITHPAEPSHNGQVNGRQ